MIRCDTFRWRAPSVVGIRVQREDLPTLTSSIMHQPCRAMVLVPVWVDAEALRRPQPGPLKATYWSRQKQNAYTQTDR